MKIIHTVRPGGDEIARGVLSANLEKYHYPFVALGDGFLLTYSVNLNSVAADISKLSCSVNNTDVKRDSIDAGGSELVSGKVRTAW